MWQFILLLMLSTACYSPGSFWVEPKIIDILGLGLSPLVLGTRVRGKKISVLWGLRVYLSHESACHVCTWTQVCGILNERKQAMYVVAHKLVILSGETHDFYTKKIFSILPPLCLCTRVHSYIQREMLGVVL